MSVLVVGAGAAGGCIGAALVAGGRDVTLLVHPGTLERLAANGLRVRRGDQVATTRVSAITVSGLSGPYDIIVIAVRTSVVESAIEDIRDAVGPATRIVPVMNGMRHLSKLAAAFGEDRVLASTTRLATSLAADGTIIEFVPGIQMEIGQLDGGRSADLERTAAELAVQDIAVRIRADAVAAMWEKFAFITATAVLTCLVGDDIGPIARADGGIQLARRVLAEVSAVAAAEGYPLADAPRAGLEGVLTDPTSQFGPSMFRDMRAGRPIEVTVLGDLADRARDHHIDTPLLDAAMVVIDVHNRRVKGQA